MSDKQSLKLAGAPKPRDYLSRAESLAITYRKYINSKVEFNGSSGSSRPVDAALELIGLIETLSRYGQRANAEEAMDIVGRVDALIDALRNEIHFLESHHMQHDVVE